MTRVTPGTMTVAVFALVVGLGGAYVVRHHLGTAPTLPGALPQPAPATVRIPVALTDLEDGRVIDRNDIGIITLSQADYEKSAYPQQSYITSSDQIRGRTLKNGVKKGELFAPENLYAVGDGPGIAERLEAGYRAVTVPVKDVGAVQGFARPGSFVDVLFRSDNSEQHPEWTLTLIEKAEVLAINANVLSGRAVSLDTPGSVTLAVTPQQAKWLKVVEGRGEISLILRNPEDPFEFIPFDGDLEQSLSQLAEDDVVMPNAFPATAATTASRTSRSSNAAADARAGADADSIEGVDRVIGNAVERLTLHDLLGIPPREQKASKMDVYLGSDKQTLTFDEDGDSTETLQRAGGRIQTPIVERRVPGRRPLGTTFGSN